jgi:hypothetical protein
MQSNATSNNPCTGFSNNDSGDGDGGSMHDGNNVDVVEYGHGAPHAPHAPSQCCPFLLAFSCIGARCLGLLRYSRLTLVPKSLNPPKISSFNAISQIFPTKWQQIHSISFSGHQTGFILMQSLV